MPTTLPQGRRHQYDELALYVQVEGKLVDAFKVEYEISDESQAYPGVLIEPGEVRVDVTATSGHFATGCYGVYAPDDDAAWTPDDEILRGRVIWYFTIVEGGPEFIAERLFEVLSVTRRPANNLFFAQDLVEHPQLAAKPPAPREAFLVAKEWTARIEQYCGQFFYPKRCTRRLKWRLNAHLFLSIPLYALWTFRDIEDPTPINNDDLVIFGVDKWERQNPKIEMRGGGPRFGLSQMTTVSVSGVWGFFGKITFDTPEELSAVALRAIATMLYQGLGLQTAFPVGPLQREKTDGHEVEYGISSTAIRSGMMALIRSPELRDQLDVFRAPITLAMTGAI